MENNSKKVDVTNFNTSAPWYLFYKEIYELFKYDPEVELNFYEANDANGGMPKLEVIVDSLDKADALDRLLPLNKQFGNVTLNIEIVRPDYGEEKPVQTLKRAFRDNPALSGIKTNDLGSYAVFKNQVVQYFTDNIGDIRGNRSTLYEEIAREVIGDIPGVFFCTGEQPAEWSPFNQLFDEDSKSRDLEL